MKGLLQKRIEFIEGILLQAGKRLSKSTVTSLKKIVSDLQAMMDSDGNAEEAKVNQSADSVGDALMQSVVTGESTRDSYEAIKERVRTALKDQKVAGEGYWYYWILYTWDNHVVFSAEKYAEDKYETKQYRANFAESGGIVTFSNITEVSVEQVVLQLQSLIQQKPVLQIGEPESRIAERGDGKLPVLLQVLPSSVMYQGKTTDGRIKFSGVATHGNVLNQNKPPIVYPTDEWAREMPKMQSLIQDGKALGCLGHPLTDNGRYREPLLQEYSHKFTSLTQDGDLFNFEAETLSTSAGKELASLIQDEVALDMSTAAIGKLKKGDWLGQSAYIAQNISWLRIADVVLHGASPGSQITEVRLQSLDTEPEEEKKMTPEEIKALLQSLLEAAGVSGLQTDLQALAQKVEGMGSQTVTMSDEDKAVIAQAKEIVEKTKADAEAKAILQARDAKIAEIVPTFMTEQKVPVQYQGAVVDHFKEMCRTADEVTLKQARVLEIMKPFLEQHQLMQSKGFYVAEYNDDGTSKSKLQSLDQGINELLDSAEERGLIQKSNKTSLPYVGADGEPLRDFSDMRQNLYQMCRTLVETHPHVGAAYMKLRNGEMKNLSQSVDLLSAAGMDYLMQTGEGTVKADIAAAVPYLLPMMLEIYPQLVVNLFSTIQPLNRSGGRIYYVKHRYDDDHAEISAVANFTGSYTNNNTENSQVKYIDLQLTSENVTPTAKKLGWKASANVIRNLAADFGIDARSDLVRMCAAVIAMEWNYNHLGNILSGATAGNVNYGTAIPADSSFDGEQWQKQFHRHVQKARGLIWKKTFADTTYVFGDSDAIDRIIDATEVGQYTGNGRGTIAKGVNIVGSLSSGETLVKIGWWDSMTGYQDKLVVAGRGNMWPETGYIIAPYLGLYMTPEHIDPDFQQHKQSMMSEVADKMVDGNYFATITIQEGTAGTPL